MPRPGPTAINFSTAIITFFELTKKQSKRNKDAKGVQDTVVASAIDCMPPPAHFPGQITI